MAQTAETFPASIVDLDDGDMGWVGPENALTSNNVYTYTTGFSAQASSAHLEAYFDFDIPLTATIVGIEAKVERHCSIANGFTDLTVRLMQASTVYIGDDKPNAALWPTSDAVRSYGGPSDHWNAGVTPAIANGSEFGLMIAVISGLGEGEEARIDAISMIIYYTLPGGASGSAQRKTNMMVGMGIG